MTIRFMAQGKGRTLAGIVGDPKAREALRQARAALGARAIVRHEPTASEPCVVLRAEQVVSGRRYEKEYGRGSTWPIAVQRAAEAYQALLAEVQGRGGAV